MDINKIESVLLFTISYSVEKPQGKSFYYRSEVSKLQVCDGRIHKMTNSIAV